MLCMIAVQCMSHPLAVLVNPQTEDQLPIEVIFDVIRIVKYAWEKYPLVSVIS